MRRIRTAFCIILLVGALAVGSHLAVHRITETVQIQLGLAREAALREDYSTAADEINTLIAYYEEKQHLLELFIKRESVANASISLHGLCAYTDPEVIRDLCSEIDKAKEQFLMMEHLYFSVF